MGSQIPAHLRRVLVVDDDPKYLQDFLQIMNKFHYEATASSSWQEALDLLKEANHGFGFVICAINKPDMDGFKLLEHASRVELNLPVIMMSDGEDTSMTEKGMNLGACHHLLKPVQEDALKLVWLQAYKKVETDSNKINHGSRPSQETVPGNNCGDPRPVPRKERFIWTPVYCEKLEQAVNVIGLGKATPKNVMKIMNMPGLTRDIVSSRLQKYKAKLKKEMENERKDIPNVTASVDNSLPRVRTENDREPCGSPARRVFLKRFPARLGVDLGAESAQPQCVVTNRNGFTNSLEVSVTNSAACAYSARTIPTCYHPQHAEAANMACGLYAVDSKAQSFRTAHDHSWNGRFVVDHRFSSNPRLDSFQPHVVSPSTQQCSCSWNVTNYYHGSGQNGFNNSFANSIIRGSAARSEGFVGFCSQMDLTANTPMEPDPLDLSVEELIAYIDNSVK